MDNLIEKYGFKKMLFIVLGGIIVLVTVVLLINSSSSKKKLLECSKSTDINSDLKFDSNILIYKDKENYELDLKFKYTYDQSLNIDDLGIGKDWLDENILDEYSSIKQYAKTSFELKDNYIKYDISYDVTKDNYMAFMDIFDVDFYSMSVDEIRSAIESGGFRCTE